MNTTGFFLTKKKIDLLSRTRLSIRFSIHSGTAETYEKIMGQDFDKVINNISYLVKESESNGKSHDFWFSYIVMNDNVDEIEDFLRIAHGCGIKHVRFMRLSPRPFDRKDLKMSDRDYVFNYAQQSGKQTRKRFIENMPRFEELAKDLDIEIETGSLMSRYSNSNTLLKLANKATTRLLRKRYFPLLPRRGMCAAPWIGQLNINQEGNVRMCCQMPGFSLGNIHDSSLKEIWNSTRAKHIRESFKKGYIPHACGYCNGFDFSEYPNNSKFRVDQL
jgi:radical SAM protein with 4Fe4S-binding SPASM domain